MDERTHKALLSSIEKWERNAEAETVLDYTIGIASCALCQLFVSIRRRPPVVLFDFVADLGPWN